MPFSLWAFFLVFYKFTFFLLQDFKTAIFKLVFFVFQKLIFFSSKKNSILYSFLFFRLFFEVSCSKIISAFLDIFFSFYGVFLSFLGVFKNWNLWGSFSRFRQNLRFFSCWRIWKKSFSIFALFFVFEKFTFFVFFRCFF